MLVYSCFFNEEADATPWFESNDVPLLTDVATLVLDNMIPFGIQTGLDSTPTNADSLGAIGFANGIQQDLFLQIASSDTSALYFIRTADSTSASLRLSLDSNFYDSYDKTVFPVEDSVTVSFAWKLSSNLTSGQVEDILSMAGSEWRDSMLSVIRTGKDWEKSDTTTVISVTKSNSYMDLPLPAEFLAELKAAQGKFQVDLRISLLNAAGIYRIYGPAVYASLPRLLLKGRTEQDTAIRIYSGLSDTTDVWMRMAQSAILKESATTDILLHGGVNESLLVNIPTEAIWNALQKNRLPNQTDSILNENMVLLAILDLPTTPDTLGSELGLSVPVLSYAYLDSITLAAAGLTNTRITESRRIDTTDIQKNGRANLAFYTERDTVEIQITQAIRHWLQVGRYENAKIQVGLRLNWQPLWAPKDYHSADYTNDADSTVEVYSDHFAYTRWNLGAEQALRARLRIWLAEQR